MTTPAVPRGTDPLAQVLAEVAVAVVLRRREAAERRAKITVVHPTKEGKAA